MKFVALTLFLFGCAYSVDDTQTYRDESSASLPDPTVQFPVNAPTQKQPSNQMQPFNFQNLGNDDGVGSNFGPSTGCDAPPCTQPSMR